MVEVLEKLKEAQHGHGENPFIFTMANAEAIFNMLDPNMNGFITYQQYQHGLETLGIINYDIMPPGIGRNEITKEAFLAEAQRGLDYYSSTYQKISGVKDAHVAKDEEEEKVIEKCTC
ncbi:unnamed protein product [Mesocestoides corti]|uniref:EF-hand domain-containing protein n=1 Tax=Mesocestoides corti TaxID=53468 RepID=A0A0R3U5N3_MESCO|nr:unnamed protein product [Mesocestoides corti]